MWKFFFSRKLVKYQQIKLRFFFSIEIPNFLTHEECDHIIHLAKKKGLKMSETTEEGLKYDTSALGKNTKKHFDLWDQNKDGQIDMDEVHCGPF